MLSMGVPQSCVSSLLLYLLFIYALHPCARIKLHWEVYRWHRSGAFDQRKQWRGLQGGGGTSSCLVFRKRPDPQHQEDRVALVDNRRCRNGSYTALHQREWGGACLCLQAPGSPHHQQPYLEHQHIQPVQESKKHWYSLLTLKKAELSSKILPNFYKCSIESTLTRCITVWHSSCTAADRRDLQGSKTPVHHRHSQEAHLWKRLATSSRTPLIQTTNCWLCFPLERGTRASVPESASWKTASYTQLSACWTVDSKNNTHNHLLNCTNCVNTVESM